jgi:DNA-directed RNA polymerase specialized sigma24 family protein
MPKNSKNEDRDPKSAEEREHIVDERLKENRKKAWGKVVEAIHGLPEPARTILVKRILEANTFAQIAALVKKPVATIQTIYYRNTELLRKKLGIPGL